jgi:ABC-2 type transport system ATP-binding protein
MAFVLDLQQVNKTYGDRVALQDVSLSVKEGSCFGLLGPNGAGKSTMMKLITGIITPNAGTLEVLGLNTKKNTQVIQKQIGYVPQSITLYEELTATDNLIFFGELVGVRGVELQQRITDVLERTGLSDRAKDEVRTFSGGMKRRINIAAALLHKPKLLILDEPTVGIDPQSRNLIFELIRSLNKQGMTIVYSTHYMEEVETLCDEIAIIDHGNVIAKGDLQDLLSQHTKPAIYIESFQLTSAPKLDIPTTVSAKGNGWVIETGQVLSVLQQLTELATKHSWDVKKLEILHPSLEDVFLTLTGTKLRDE